MKKRKTVSLTDKQYELVIMAKAELEKERRESVTIGQAIAETAIQFISKRGGNVERNR